MVSLVIPIFNEEELIDELVPRTIKALEQIPDDFELILVDDGSVDSSLQKLVNHQQKDRRIKVIQLSKNFGHQAAFTAGLENASGDYVAMMDGDLQDPPELLLQMYQKLSQDQYDIVNGRRLARKGNRAKNWMTGIFHRLFKAMTHMEVLENAGNFSMMNRKALAALLSMEERVRYLPGLRSFVGFQQGFVDYVREDRLQGEPKMTLGKLFLLAADAIFSFSKFPIRLCLTLGLIGTVVFLLAGIYVLIAKFMGFALLGWSSTVLSIYFLGSIQLIFLGVVGEYVYRIYKESQKRPLYFIKTIYSSEEQ
ncbi:glycosyltransferase family 2 protein [uncultured Sunxiuqinia sp.]|uniref:glycosyltransferase family 2 protein n=1 Tax=Sunxiuqinia rutila TaxID=1397841 RepID=UPI0026029D7E|nr:glycosyltransferase family 2 protein [uncultured Sunxiuqinia sp.]